jgi:hypothetical protein
VTTVTFLLLREAVVLQGACNDNESTFARREDATIKSLYAVDRNDDGNSSTFSRCIARCDDTKQWLIVTKMRMPSNNQPNFYVALQERATIAKRQLLRCDDHALRRVARGYDEGNDS